MILPSYSTAKSVAANTYNFIYIVSVILHCVLACSYTIFHLLVPKTQAWLQPAQHVFDAFLLSTTKIRKLVAETKIVIFSILLDRVIVICKV